MKLKKLLISAIACVLAIMLVACGGNTDTSEIERNLDDEQMQIGFKNVYADVISFSPQGFVVTTTTRNGVKLPNSALNEKDVVCLCTTVKGTQFYVSIPEHSYRGIVDVAKIYGTTLDRLTLNTLCDLEFDMPIRIKGKIMAPEDVAEDFAEEFDAGYVLVVGYLNTDIEIPENIQCLTKNPLDDITVCPTVTVDSGDVALKVGESKDVLIQISGSLDGELYLNFTNEGELEYAAEWSDWLAENTIKLTITGIEPGNTTLRIRIVDSETNELLDPQVEGIINLTVE